MGVRGLTTFIANRSRQYHESYELHDSYLVIDGNSIASQLYKWHCRCNDCFGGDYDKYANVIYTFFQLLSDCGVTPLIVFDGAYEKRKLKTVYNRMKNKIGAARVLNAVSEGTVSVFPLFLREVFVDVVLKLGLKCARCDFEGDSEAANLAHSLQCPILSYDSDFYIFDVLYIPFSSMELKLRKNKNFNYIACEKYSVDKFLNSFGGLDKIHLPLLAVMLGNDYIKKSTFSVFYRQLKIVKTKGNEQQTLIKSLIMWLKDETPESALRKILGRYKMENRRKIATKVKNAIKDYEWGESQICSDFNLDPVKQQTTCISVPNPEDIEDAEEQEEEDTSENSAEEEEETEEDQVPDVAVRKSNNLPDYFRENFRKCVYPSCFMDMIVSDTYYCLPQVEDFSVEHSHKICFNILAAIHKILTLPRKRHLKCLARQARAHIEGYKVPAYKKPVPNLSDLEDMNSKKSKRVFLGILNMQNNMFEAFPRSWHIFLISTKYWITKSQSKIGLPHIYSTVLCAIIRNCVDAKVGFYRSTKSFLSKYSSNKPDVTNPADTNDVTEALDNIDLNNSIACMQKLIHYFQMDVKMKSNVRLFDRTVVHHFAEFQSCLLHIKYLNSLLNRPFDTFFISDFYDGTFLYNMTANLVKRTDLKAYVKILLEGCPAVLSAVELIVGQIEELLASDIKQHEPPKKRRRKKKARKEIVNEGDVMIVESDEEYEFDENNIYSLLSFINK
jgi:hypothetical protein